MGSYGEDTLSEIWRFSSYTGEDCWEKTGTKTYKVVGKYSCGMFEKLYLAGFTGITKADEDMQPRSAALFATVKDTDWVTNDSFSMDIYDAHPDWESVIVDKNQEYLNITESLGFEIKAMIIGMIVTLMLIIAFGSIALIYNSFSISINERKRQYGLKVIQEMGSYYFIPYQFFRCIRKHWRITMTVPL